MKKALGQNRINELSQEDAGQGDTEGIGKDCHGYGSEQQHDPLPWGLEEKPPHEQSHKNGRPQVAQPAARIHHLKLNHTEVDDVALSKHRDLQQPKRLLGQIGRNQPQPKTRQTIDECRERYGKNADQHGQPESAEGPLPKGNQRHAAKRRPH